MKGFTMEFLILLVLCVGFAGYGLYKYNKAEVNAYVEMDLKYANLVDRIEKLEAQKIFEQKEIKLVVPQPLQVDIIEKPKAISTTVRQKLLKSNAKKVRELSK